MHDVEPAREATTPHGRDETSPRYPGWRVVLACFLMAQFLFAFGLYGQSLYLTELQRLNGWPTALISGIGSFMVGCRHSFWLIPFRNATSRNGWMLSGPKIFKNSFVWKAAPPFKDSWN